VEGKSYLFRDSLEWDWPMEVTLWEAEAFVAWKNAGLLDSQHEVYALPNGVIAVVEPVCEQAVYHGFFAGMALPDEQPRSSVDVLPPSICGTGWKPVGMGDRRRISIHRFIHSTAPTTEQESHAVVGGSWTSSDDPATSGSW
jgi:hypothetical protein